MQYLILSNQKKAFFGAFWFITLKEFISFLKNQDKKLNIFKENNIAKKIALKLYKKQPIIIGAEFFIGNLRVLRNQFCENSKNFASYLTIPELNHYALESLINPKSNKEILSFFFLDSNLYHPRIQKRSELTKQIVKKNKIEIISYEAIGKNKMEQSFEILQIGTWVTFYLAILNEIDPSQVPWVDWFKKELK